MAQSNTEVRRAELRKRLAVLRGIVKYPPSLRGVGIEDQIAAVKEELRAMGATR